MPKVAECTFKKCAHGLRAADRSKFTRVNEAHWKACHVNEPVKFKCPYTGVAVALYRDPQSQFNFTCVCSSSRLLHAGSVKRHYKSCPYVKERALAALGESSSTYQTDDLPASPDFDTAAEEPQQDMEESQHDMEEAPDAASPMSMNEEDDYAPWEDQLDTHTERISETDEVLQSLASDIRIVKTSKTA
ncbi:hypothetical protein BGZ73_005105 [Actinomortierella ambigua]|nr:hypothetical protein BGZ73_005105 [Actinomortierella ambigua]